MRKIVFCFFCFAILTSCGSGCFLGDCDETESYTYKINNETGTSVLIKVGDIEQEVFDKESFECSYSRTSNSGLCQGSLEIHFLSINKGYRCFNAVSNVEGLCFVEDGRVFTPSNGVNGIFEETNTRTYEYTLTPELLDGAFELPE